MRRTTERTSTSTKKKVVLVRQRSYLIPGDTESYRLLHRLRVPNVRFDVDFLDTLKVLFRKHRIDYEEQQFPTVLRGFMSRVYERWISKSYRKARMTKTELRFETRNLATARDTCQKLELALRTFFERWAIDSTFDYSESPTRAKLVVHYAVSKERLPIIPFKDL